MESMKAIEDDEDRKVYAVKRFRKQSGRNKDSDKQVKIPSATYNPPRAFRTAETNVIFHRF